MDNRKILLWNIPILHEGSMQAMTALKLIYWSIIVEFYVFGAWGIVIQNSLSCSVEIPAQWVNCSLLLSLLIHHISGLLLNCLHLDTPQLERRKQHYLISGPLSNLGYSFLFVYDKEHCTSAIVGFGLSGGDSFCNEASVVSPVAQLELY